MKHAMPYIVKAISTTNELFMRLSRIIATESPQTDIVVWGIFRYSYTNCAGDKLGTAMVMPIRNRKTAANTTLANIVWNMCAPLFFTFMKLKS